MWRMGEALPVKTGFRQPNQFDDKAQLQQLMLEAVEQSASDIYFQTGNPVLTKVHGRLHQLTSSRLSQHEVSSILEWACGSSSQASGLLQGREVRTSYSVQHPTERDNFGDKKRYRFRVNAVRGEYRNALSAQIVMRSIRSEPATIEDVKLEPELVEAFTPETGICWMTGPTGSGKSTTFCAEIRYICENDTPIQGNICTLEHPIEATFDNVVSAHSVVHQVEVERDIPSFHDGIKSFMRMDPSLIVVGETRDEMTASASMEAAKTGHPVLSTLHANDCASVPSRLLSFYPPEQRATMIFDIIDTARVLCNQQLVLHKNGQGRVALREFLILDADMRDHIIRKADPERLTAVLRGLVREHGRTFSASAERAYDAGLISPQTLDSYRKAHG